MLKVFQMFIPVVSIWCACLQVCTERFHERTG